MIKKKLVIVSCLCVIVLALASCNPALASKPLAPILNTVPIEMTHYNGIHQVQTITAVSPADALHIEQCLKDLSNAQQRNDQTTIAHCIAFLNSKGIAINAREQTLLSPQRISQSFARTMPYNLLSNNITNKACFFTATGQGMLLGTIALRFLKVIGDAINNQTSILAKFILLLVFLPLILVAFLLNDLIPIRILMPVGALVLANGTMSSIGLLGVKSMKVTTPQISVGLTWFTGLTINIPPLTNESKPFTFISGFAAQVVGP